MHINNENGNVRKRAAASPQRGERFVPRSVDEQNAGDANFFAGKRRPAQLLYGVDWNNGGANCLGDRACFLRSYSGLANGV